MLGAVLLAASASLAGAALPEGAPPELVSAWQDGGHVFLEFSGPVDVGGAAPGDFAAAGANVSVVMPHVWVSTLAGTTDRLVDGPGASAQFRYPADLDVAPDGTVYVADSGNGRVRAVAPDGEVSTVAPSPAAAECGGRMRDPRFKAPEGIAVMPASETHAPTLFVADAGTGRAYLVGPSGCAEVLAPLQVTRGGPPPDGSRLPPPPRPAMAAFWLPDDPPLPLGALVVDGPGRLRLLDTGFLVPLFVDLPSTGAAPVDVTISPDGAAYVLYDPPGLAAVVPVSLVPPAAVPWAGGYAEAYAAAAAPGGGVYVAVSEGGADPDPRAHDIRIVRVWPDGSERAVAGSSRGMADGPALFAKFGPISAMAAGPDGVLYVADYHNHRIRAVTPDGRVSTLAGSDHGHVDGPASLAQFDRPLGLAAAPDGSVYVGDAGGERLRRVSPGGNVSTPGGPPPEEARAALGGGHATSALFRGHTYASEGDAVVRTGPGRPSVVLAGSSAGYADGPGARALFDGPAGVAAGPDGTVYVADPGNHRIRQLRDCPSGVILELDGPPGAAALSVSYEPRPGGLAGPGGRAVAGFEVPVAPGGAAGCRGPPLDSAVGEVPASAAQLRRGPNPELVDPAEILIAALRAATSAVGGLLWGH